MNFEPFHRANESNSSGSQSNSKQTYEGYTSHQRQSKYETKPDVNSPSTVTSAHTCMYVKSNISVLYLLLYRWTGQRCKYRHKVAYAVMQYTYTT